MEKLIKDWTEDKIGKLSLINFINVSYLSIKDNTAVIPINREDLQNRVSSRNNSQFIDELLLENDKLKLNDENYIRL